MKNSSLALLVCLLLAGCAAPEAQQPEPVVTVGTLEWSEPTNKDIPIWKSEEAIRDCVAEKSMCPEGVVKSVTPGVRVRFIEDGERAVKIKVLEGPAKGLEGFVPRITFVKQ